MGNRFIMSAMNADTHPDFKEVHCPEPGPGRQAGQTKAVNDRLFLALWPPDETKAGLVTASAAWSWPHGSALVPPERLHVTVHFIGSVPTSAVPFITKRLAVPIEPFSIELCEAQLWPGGIAVMVPRAVPAALLVLHAELSAALGRLGLPLELRPFRPHVTLARRAAGAVIPVAPKAVNWTVNRYLLVRSLPGGAGYEMIRAYH
ncbi:MAG: 2-5 ligase [Polaromonas sp.]|nr:2-5 ligase [Polaromonas sp.]MDB5844416.1 2-5 ligase [Polaromonas sp.]